MKQIKKIIIFNTVCILSFYSFICIWGWLTVEEVKIWSKENNTTIDEIYSLIEQPWENLARKISNNNIGSSAEIKAINFVKRINSGFYLHKIPKDYFDRNINNNDSLGLWDKMHIMIPFWDLKFYLGLPEKMLNLLACLSIGYLTSLIIVGIENLKSNSEMQFRRLILRPVIGGLSSMILLIVIYSGGSIIWNEIGGVRGLSLGTIAVLASLYCERFFEKLLITL
jgi:hypothetical protein